MEAVTAERSTARVPYNPERSDRVVVHLPKVLTEAVDAYQRRMMIGTRSEALRRLVQTGLEAEGSPELPAAPAAPRRRGRGKGRAR